MVASFRDKETEKVFNRYFSKYSPYKIHRSALLPLRALSQARNIHDLHSPPSNHLENVRSSPNGKYSIKINDRWKICFKWEGDDAHEVEIIQSHSNRGAE